MFSLRDGRILSLRKNTHYNIYSSLLHCCSADSVFGLFVIHLMNFSFASFFVFRIKPCILSGATGRSSLEWTTFARPRCLNENMSPTDGCHSLRSPRMPMCSLHHSLPLRAL